MKQTVYSDVHREGIRMEFEDLIIIGTKPHDEEQEEDESELETVPIYCRNCPVAC